MKKLFHNRAAIVGLTGLCVGIGAVVLVVTASVSIAQVTWEEPTSQPPGGNKYAPLNTGPGDQAKQGGLLLDPFYNYIGPMPTMSYPLEVRGPQNVSISSLEVPSGQDTGQLTVDTDTLYVDAVSHRVGFGTAAPSSLAEVSGGSLDIGSAASPIAADPALYVASQSAAGLYATSTASGAVAAIYGVSGAQPGVFGYNLGTGAGIRADSGSSSAVVGTTDAPLSTGSTVQAGVYAVGKGLGAWAGYFGQRVYGSDAVVGRQFIESQPAESQVPYTQTWEVRLSSDSKKINPVHLLYANGYVWVAQEDSVVYVVNPLNGYLVGEIELSADFENDPGHPVNANHGIGNMVYAEGYIWALGDTWDEPIVSRFTPDPDIAGSSVRQFILGTAFDDDDVRDLVYDDITPGGPFLWIASSDGPGEGDQHSIVRLTINESSPDYGDFIEVLAPDASCITLDAALCTDRLDNNGDGTIDHGLCVFSAPIDVAECSVAGGTWTPGTCTDSRYADQTSCEGAPADKYGYAPRWVPGTCSTPVCSQVECEAANHCSGGTWTEGSGCSDANCLTQATCGLGSGCGETWTPLETDCNPYTATPGASVYDPDAPDVSPDTDERLIYRQLGVPFGIAFDGTDVWTVGGMLTSDASSGEAVVKINAADPENASLHDYYCIGPARDARDITYDSGNDQLWIGQAPSWHKPGTFHGLSRFDMAAGKIAETYLNSVYGFGVNINKVEYDDISAGGPWVWAAAAYNAPLNKFHINDEEIKHQFIPPGGIPDFSIDRETAGGPYAWSSLYYASAVGRSLVNEPYTTVVYTPKGVGREDIAFDGEFIWTANGYAQSISKYRSSDSEKVADYGGFPSDVQHIMYDGSYLWAVISGGSPLAKVDPRTGNIIEIFTYAGEHQVGWDWAFDGTNLWLSLEHKNMVQRIDLTSCSAGTCGVTQYANIFQPYELEFDGTYVWITHTSQASSDVSLSDSLTRIRVSDGAVEGPFIVLDDEHGGNITALEYDGTYLWIGTSIADYYGNSVFKLDIERCGEAPDYVDACPVAGRYKIYHDSGVCSVSKTYCTASNDCPATEYCSNIRPACTYGDKTDVVYSRVDQMLFDGMNMWVTNMTPTDCSSLRECSTDNSYDEDGDGLTGNSDPNCERTYDAVSYDHHERSICDDGIDNDNDGTCDWNGCGGLPADSECVVAGYPNDLQLDTEGASLFTDGKGLLECRDGLDNDGNGLCDWDGAAGSPGCSGKPDPGCDVPNDASEAARPNDAHLTKINAATDEVVESILYGAYCSSSGLAYDGTDLWIANYACESGYEYSAAAYYTLYQYYSGNGRGVTDIISSVNLSGIDAADPQQGDIALGGSATFGGSLYVNGDIVVPGNTWAGTADHDQAFGDGCAEGEFVKGIDLTAGSESLQCRPL
ncbi:MAG: hypothetical protein WC505_04745 [Patescibacteria group bacterium]